MFMSFGKSLGFGEIEGSEIYKCSWKETSENVAIAAQSLNLAYITDP